MLKTSEIKKMDKPSIIENVSKLRRELFDLRLQRSTTNLDKPHLLKSTRRDIARLLTELNLKERE